MKSILFGPRYFVLVGLPGSGKSTVANQLQGFHMSTDALVEAYAVVEGKTYNEVWPDAIRWATKEFDIELEHHIECNHTIIHDQTNLSVKKRKAVLAKVPDHYTKIAIYVYCNEEQRQERLLQRPGKVIPKHVDDSMRASLVPPHEAEGFDYIEIVDSSTM